MRVQPFSNPPTVGDAFYLAFERDHSHHVLGLLIECEEPAGVGVDPTAPPLVWEVPRADQWVQCEVEYDGTAGLNMSGEVVLHIPESLRTEVAGQSAWWLRCRFAPIRAHQRYDLGTTIRELTIEARGATVRSDSADQAGSSPGQFMRGTVSVLMQSIPYVTSVTNREAAVSSDAKAL